MALSEGSGWRWPRLETGQAQAQMKQVRWSQAASTLATLVLSQAPPHSWLLSLFSP